MLLIVTVGGAAHVVAIPLILDLPADCVAPGKPLSEIDIGTAFRAKRPVGFDRDLTADRAFRRFGAGWI